MRSLEETCEIIVDMPREDGGRLVDKIRRMPGVSDDQKDARIKFVMMLSMIGDRFPKDGKKAVPS